MEGQRRKEGNSEALQLRDHNHSGVSAANTRLQLRSDELLTSYSRLTAVLPWQCMFCAHTPDTVWRRAIETNLRED